MNKLETLPLELFDKVLGYLDCQAKVRLSQSNQAIREYLMPRRGLDKLKFSPPHYGSRLLSTVQGGLDVTASNAATFQQALTKGEVDFLLPFITKLVIVHAQQWPADMLPTRSMIPNAEHVKVSITGVARKHCFDQLFEDFPHAQVEYTTTQSDYPPGWLRPFINRLDFMCGVKLTLHSSALLQNLAPMHQLTSLKLHTTRLANPIALNWIPSTVKRLHWTDDATCPSMMAFTQQVEVKSVEHLVLRTQHAYDIGQYHFPNAKHVELHCLDYRTTELAALVRKRLKMAVNRDSIESLFFNMPLIYLPEMTAPSLEQLTLNALNFRTPSSKQMGAMLKKHPNLRQVNIDYVLWDGIAN